MREAFRKISLHHQALYGTNNVTEFTSATKLRIKIKNIIMVYNKASMNGLMTKLTKI